MGLIGKERRIDCMTKYKLFKVEDGTMQEVPLETVKTLFKGSDTSDLIGDMLRVIELYQSDDISPRKMEKPLDIEETIVDKGTRNNQTISAFVKSIIFNKKRIVAWKVIDRVEKEYPYLNQYAKGSAKQSVYDILYALLRQKKVVRISFGVYRKYEYSRLRSSKKQISEKSETLSGFVKDEIKKKDVFSIPDLIESIKDHFSSKGEYKKTSLKNTPYAVVNKMIKDKKLEKNGDQYINIEKRDKEMEKDALIEEDADISAANKNQE